jgi:hypothetical protein
MWLDQARARALPILSKWEGAWRGNRVVRIALIAASILILVVLLVYEIRIAFYSMSSEVRVDFASYYQAALAVREERDPFASVGTWIASYQPGRSLTAADYGLRAFYVYSPFFAALLIPFTLLPVNVAYVLWSLCNLAFLVGAIYAALRVCGLHPSLLHVALLSVAAALWNDIRLELQWGQADLFVLFFVAASLWAGVAKRPILAGILLALACLTKPFLLCLVVALLWKREYRYALVSVGAFAIGLIAPFLWLGGNAWQDQLTVWSFWSNQFAAYFDNQAPKGIFARLFTLNPYATPLLNAPWLMTTLWLVVAALVALIVAACVSRRRLASDDQTLVELSLIITAILLISPLTEYIYLLMLILPMVLLVTVLQRRGWWAERYRPITLSVGLVWLLLIFPLKSIQYFFTPRLAAASGAPLVVMAFLAVPYLYVIIGLFALELWLWRLITGSTLREGFRRLQGELLALLQSLRAIGDRALTRAGRASVERTVRGWPTRG